jgi:D-alanyl-D-alanine carboxypeptidase/D-alanyl-D-alanine-endopeptidase (penicillin-binding protein 4)
VGRGNGRQPALGWLIAAVTVLAVSLAGGGAAVASTDRIAAALDGTTYRWRAGTTPPPPQPVLGALSSDGPMPSGAAVEAVMDPLMTNAGLGTHTTASVIDAVTGTPLYERGSHSMAVPASTTKLVTATTVLTARGPTYRLATRAVAGSQPGEVVLVGGGDPTLAAGAVATYPDAAKLTDLAAQVKQASGGVAPTRVLIDTSLFSGANTGPGWTPDTIPQGFVAPITALMVDGGRVDASKRGASKRSTQPDLAAGVAFAAALGLPASAVARGQAAPAAKQLGSVLSPPVLRLVEIMLTDSDNVIAEFLARQVALARDQPASFEGAAQATRTVLGELGLTTGEDALVDGSGLSYNDRISPALLTATLAFAARADRPQLRAVYTGLPVAGYSGTLQNRFRTSAAGGSAAGMVRAKTGTLTGISSIAGIAVDADGRVLAFAVVADATGPGTGAAQAVLDRIAAALASCGCR